MASRTSTAKTRPELPRIRTSRRGEIGRRRVVIVGAGFGGLRAALELRRADVDVLVLDRNNHHGSWPFGSRLATGIAGTGDIAYPVRAISRKQEHADFRVAEVRFVDVDARQVLTDQGSYRYDYLVLAGSRG